MGDSGAGAGLSATFGPQFLTNLGVVAAVDGHGDCTLMAHVGWQCLAVPVAFAGRGVAIAVPARVAERHTRGTTGLQSTVIHAGICAAGTWGRRLSIAGRTLSS